VAQGVGSTQLDKLNTRNLSCGGETDLETAKKSSQFFHKKRQKKAKMAKMGQKKGNCEILFINFCKKALLFFCKMTKL